MAYNTTLMSTKQRKASDYIASLHMNGLRGRMLYMPPRNNKKRNMLIVYGHHASIERMFGMADDLNKYGSVTIPDLPGFGGMQSFYTIGEKPTLDIMADYLASFIKMRYKRKRLTIMGMSFGFLVVTRMLQKYPELAHKVDMVVSIVGFVHHQDFKLKKPTYVMLRSMAWLFSKRIPAIVARHVFLRKLFINVAYKVVAKSHSKLKDADSKERQKRIDFEVILWQCNDVRTYMDTGITMLTVDLCNKQLDLPVYHIEVQDDRYFDNRVVEQHLNVIYNKVHIHKSTMPNHAPSIVADAKAAAGFMPKKMRRLLAQKA